ncbi:Cytochrome c5 [Andreprevotia lacus DSM 23236]|jgi:cytochrome c5|uniref:Cytochrome c5 n=1 Tax=Andreprevotia lacus DSM 23236 TaxID=1121001 RepID=A0A1W1XIE8_9NEIS|nr:c-type cytochrome [Andreprevotia lacus]SMC23739.1 Cytochrome c5 [Andreprevotia lacus DSM 23236]
MNHFCCLLIVCAGLLALTARAADAPVPVGERVVKASCAACHLPPGVDGAPLLGDHAAWQDRMGEGRAALYRNAINGYTGYFVMPARGGNAKLSDDEVKAAVDYLLDHSGVH